MNENNIKGIIEKMILLIAFPHAGQRRSQRQSVCGIRNHRRMIPLYHIFAYAQRQRAPIHTQIAAFHATYDRGGAISVPYVPCPVGPVGPVTPVPVAPVGPVGPVAPVAPVAPVGQVQYGNYFVVCSRYSASVLFEISL